MSGSGHQPDKLTDKLMSEIRSTLAMLRKEVRQHAVDFEIGGSLTVFSTGFRCKSVAVALEKPAAPVYLCRTLVDFARSHAVEVFNAKTPRISENVGSLASLKTATGQVPVFDGPFLPVHGVSFGNMVLQAPVQVPIPEPSTPPAHGVSTAGPQKPRKVFLIPPIRFKATQKARKLGSIRVKNHPAPKNLMVLPMIKAPIPLHRFDSQTRSRFRHALSEKAGCPAAKIQLNQVYDRITMSTLKSLTQDERGMLICHPKPDAVGKDRQLTRLSANAYLVAGQVLDTRQQVSALVPMSTEEAS